MGLRPLRRLQLKTTVASITIASTLLSLVNVVEANDSELCYMLTSSGETILLSKVCGITAVKPMSTFMWDENNYDPKFVERTPEGFWSVAWDAPHPFRTPGGTIVWPDGKTTTPDGITMKAILGTDGTRVGTQYYGKDGKTPLKPGETISVPNGISFEQQKI